MSYRDLKSYQGATIIYDFTVAFTKAYIKSYRTREQMDHAARSGKQNIVEGSSQKASKKSEIKLVAVARASLQELLEDFEDFLRQNDLKLWSMNSPEAQAIRRIAYQSDKSYKSYQTYLDSPEGAANTAICLINQVNFLLDRQIKSLREKFLDEGGFTETLFRERRQRRNQR